MERITRHHPSSYQEEHDDTAKMVRDSACRDVLFEKRFRFILAIHFRRWLETYTTTVAVLAKLTLNAL